jgi:putative Holliday junction resolvase
VESSHGSANGRILAIDFGTVRLGLAVSDTLGLTAQGLATIERTNKAADLRRIEQAVTEYSPVRVLIGHPISHSGAETEMSRRAVRFADELRSVLDLPVEMWDERLTSREADRFLAESGLRRTQRRESRDRVAAQILLQSYLDRHAYERERTGAQAEP